MESILFFRDSATGGIDRRVCSERDEGINDDVNLETRECQGRGSMFICKITFSQEWIIVYIDEAKGL